MESIVGKKIIAFEFEGLPGFNDDMKEKIGEIGLIERNISGHDFCLVVFSDGHTWSYPYPEILSHMVPEEEKDINELYNSVIKLINK